MNRTELVEAVAARAGSDPAAARRHVDAVFEAIMESVASGDRVLVTGFGTFDRVARPARTARNPRTGQPVEVPAGDAPRFRIGQTFRNRVAQGAEPAVEEAAEPVPAEPAAEKPKKAKKKKKTDAKKTGAKKVEAKQADTKKPVKADKKAKKPAKAKGGKGN
ncbi:HU family DNA-binding protein [Actinomadura kijaniata]|uniref:HU family DNA-binding protein n=1 Tax=Actinomadura kijaniata TaxID=46161 RepID=UPI003F195455